MREIGVRELKATLSEVLRQVEQGEPVRVTSRGRVVAEIVPPRTLTPEEHMRRLVEQGRVTPATKPHPARPPPLIDTGRSASDLIIADREDRF